MSKSKTYSFWLPENMVTEIDKLAVKNKRSRNQVVELLLSEALSRKPEKVVA